MQSLLSLVDEQLKHKVIAAAASFEQRLAEGGKDVFHLEAFVARVMADYKGFVEEMMGL